MEFINNLASMDLWYIPLIALLFFTLISMGVGFVNGWKTSLYFMAWNWVGAIIVVFTLGAFYDKFSVWINDMVGQGIDVSSATHLATGVITLVFMFCSLLVINLLAFIIYLFFRKKLKRSMKENKEASKSNLISRVSGSGIAFVTVLPMTMGIAGTATVVSNNQGINRGIDNLTSMVTFGQVTNISKNFDVFYNVIGFASIAGDFANMFTDPTSITPESLEQNQSTIESALASRETIDIMNDVITSSTDIPKEVDFTTVDVNEITTYLVDTNGQPIRFAVPQSNMEYIEQMMLGFVQPGTDEAEQRAAIQNICAQIFAPY